jgi:hypothetical protein
MHQLANINCILEPVAMFPGQADPLILYVHLVALVILEITSINHPKVEVDI